MQINFKTLYLKKRFPLRISRGLRTGSNNLFVSITKNGITGWGEMAPGKTEGADTPEAGQATLEAFFKTGLEGLSIREIFEKGKAFGLPACAQAALDIALWDQLAKSGNLPLHKMLGISKSKIPTSVTIGINPPEVIRERVPLLLDGTRIRCLKLKLGSPEGIDADKEMYAQVVESTKNYNVQLRVDANGGWSTEDAIHMMKWLADRNTDYIEQPLEEGREEDLPHIFKNRPLPIFVDESCRYASDIPKWANYVDGVNMKLMKCGGITGALQIIETAKTFNLKTMIGCMGESSISISAAAAVSGLLNHIDLDSHLNLAPDPCQGAEFINGVVVPTDAAGHGAFIKKEFKTENDV